MITRSQSILFVPLFIIVGLFCAQKEAIRFPVLKGPYLGQTPPGQTPEIFAPGILNTKAKGAFCTVFSPGLDEFYFVYYDRGVDRSGGLHRMKLADGRWSEPDWLPFSEYGRDNDMCLSADGNRMVFRSWRGLPDGKAPESHSWLWVSDRSQDGWGEARPLRCGGEVVRTGYPSLAENGTLYVAHRREGILGIYRSELVGNAYQTPTLVTTLFDTTFIQDMSFNYIPS